MELNNVEIIKIGEVKTFANDFRLLEFVVTDDSSHYRQEILFNILGDNIDNFLQYNKVGDRVNVTFNINGRSWLKDGEDESKRRWFNSLDAWMVKKVDAQMTPQEATNAIDDAFPPAEKIYPEGEDKQDLPF